DSWVLDTGSGTHICRNVQNLQHRRSLRKGEVDLRVGNDSRVGVAYSGSTTISLPTRLNLVLNNVYLVPVMSRNIISVSRLALEG
ncbi:hypothetical protein, partial [Mycobacterium tuberculosis]